MAKFHAQIWQFWKSAHISETAARRAKISSISTPWGRKRVYVQLLELWPMAKFHTQIWQFWKLACISETAARRAKISSISATWGRKRLYVQLLELWQMAKFHAQKWQFWKSARISETAAHRVKISSISTPEVEMEYIYNFWNFGKLPSWFSSRASRPIGLFLLISNL